jgi:hypothetical protein
MRSRTRWLMLLVTAGMALAAPSGRGQGQVVGPEVPPSDTVVPLPLYHDRPERGGFYTYAEFLYFRQTNPLQHQVIAQRGLLDIDGSITADLNGTRINPVGGAPIIVPGPLAPGTFIGSGTPTLFADDVGGPGTFQPGFRFGAGWRLASGAAIEFNWMSLADAHYSAVASILPRGLQPGANLAETFLFSPVFNFPSDFAGAGQKLALGNPLAAFGIWNGASVMQLDFIQRYDEYNLVGRIPCFQTDYCRCYGLIGPRVVSMWENFKWRTVSQEFDGQTNAQNAAIYSNVVSNFMYGVAAGIGNEVYLGHGFALTADLYAAGFSDFVHEIAKYERQDHLIAAKRSRRDYTFVPELQGQFNIWWYPIEAVQIRVGYDAREFFNTLASPNPVDFNFGALAPAYEHKNRFLDGLNIGIGVIF